MKSTPLWRRAARFARLWIIGPRPRLGRTGVYEADNARGRSVYVGMSSNPRLRCAQHEKTKDWWKPNVRHVRVRWYPLRIIAWAVEWHTIARRKPLYNRDRNWSNPHRVAYRDLPTPPRQRTPRPAGARKTRP